MDSEAVEELFERNADMRLLELRHSEHGRGPTSLRDASSRFSSESIVAPADQAIDDAPRLRVTIAAAPQTGVIAGALVGVAIDVYNDGTAPAPETKILLSLPIESEYHAGTLRIDGREANAPEQLFRNGLPVARLPGQTSLKVTFQLHVLPGLGALYLQPRLQTNGVPVVGTAGISIKRKAAATAAAPPEPERPFYELTEGEDDIVVTEPVLPPVDPAGSRVATAEHEPVAEPVAVVEPVAVAEPEPVAVAEPEPVAVAEPEPIVEERAPAKVARVVEAPAEERMTCFRSLTASDVATLARMFAATSPGIVAHVRLISTIACCESEHGDIPSGLGSFLAEESAALGRLLVLSRLGKPIAFPVDHETLDRLAIPWVPTESLPAGRRARKRLRRDLRPSEHAAMTGLFQRSKRDPNLRVRIALLALAAGSVDGVDAKTADEFSTSLAAYRSASLAWLVPLCVASANGPPPESEPPPPLDAAGRRVVRALVTAFPT